MGDRRLRLVLMGTGPFAVPSFDALAEAGHTIALVVTRPERSARGRKAPPPSPVRGWAERRGLPIFAPETINDPEAIARVRDAAPDLLVVCDYGQILSSEALGAAPLGGINLHGSLLPAFRGAAPVQWALLSGATETGVSVIHMTPRLDAGPVLAERRTAIREDETAGELEARLAQLGVEATREAVERLADWDGTTPIGRPQEDRQASKAPRLRKSHGRIDWDQPAEQIDRHVRAMQPWPGAYCESHSADRPPIRLVLRRVTPIESAEGGCAPPGRVVQETPELLIATGRGLLRIDRLQAAGKREMAADEYVRGNPLPPGTDLSGGGGAP